MDNLPPEDQLPRCNIDIKRPDKTHITAWRDKSEFRAVYEKIFNSPVDDIESQEDGEKMLNVWKVRQNRDIPVCVRCTLVVLEAILFDLRSQRDGRENTTETKNIYAGAFMRFINYLTEGSQDYRYKKVSIAEHVRGIGIETYLVELRHLCAHRSVSVSIDVFRKSAKYCMDWLKVSYWERELAGMQPVTVATVRRGQLNCDLAELSLILRTYDAAMAGQALGCSTVPEIRTKLTPNELALLNAFKTKKLSLITVELMVRLTKRLDIPRNSLGIAGLCDGLLANCHRMFLGPARMNKNGPPSVATTTTAPFGCLHSPLFQFLASFGCLQTLFERLMAMCENESESDEQRLGAQYWALKIAKGFQLLRQFKTDCKSLPRQQLVRFDELRYESAKQLASKVYQEWFQRTIPTDEADQHLVLGYTVDCPWHLKLSIGYLQNRLVAVNPYTSDIMPVLLSLVEPALMKRSLKEKVEQLIGIYLGPEFGNEHHQQSDDTMEKETKKVPAHATPQKGSDKIYTMEDVLTVTGTVKRVHPDSDDAGGNDSTERVKRRKRFGPWSESLEPIAWDRCPLGTYHVPAKQPSIVC